MNFISTITFLYFIPSVHSELECKRTNKSKPSLFKYRLGDKTLTDFDTFFAKISCEDDKCESTVKFRNVDQDTCSTCSTIINSRDTNDIVSLITAGSELIKNYCGCSIGLKCFKVEILDMKTTINNFLNAVPTNDRLLPDDIPLGIEKDIYSLCLRTKGVETSECN